MGGVRFVVEGMEECGGRGKVWYGVVYMVKVYMSCVMSTLQTPVLDSSDQL